MKEELTENNIPEGWIKLKLSEVALLNMGQSPPSDTYNLNGIGLPFFQGKTDFGDYSPTPRIYCSEPVKIAKAGDVLISVRAPVGPTNLANNDCCIGRGLAGLTALGGISNKYLLYQLRSIEHKIAELGSGSTFKAISKENLENLEILVAPQEEQYRIIIKLEEALSELDHSVENLRLAHAQLKIYRKVILQQAFEGRLTEHWRRENKVEPANRLLKQIKKEVQDWYEQEIEYWKRELLKWEKKGKDGVRPIKPKAKKAPYILSGENQTDLPILPNGWDWTTLESFTAITGGVTKGKRYGNIDTIELPYLSVANVQDGYFDLSQIKNIRIAHNELKKYQLKYGDILYTEGGDKDKLGRGAMWKGEIDNCIHQNHVFRARVLSSEVNPVFCALFSRTKVAKDYFYRNDKQTTNLASINLTVLSKLPFPLPSRAEQDLIVEIIESKFSLLENLENTLNAGLTECQSLKYSLLKMAFNGKLVPHDTGDMPANLLLKKIAIERKEFLIAEKQRRASFKQTEKSKRKMAKQLREILELLKESSEPIRTKDLWEDSIYKDDIDSFYAALKKHLEEGVIVELPRQGRESYIKLADK